MSENQAKDDLASWVTERVDQWETWRDNNYKDRWDEYYRLWRGIWLEVDKNRSSERSRIICPELSQAIETSVAELEDATFIRDRWVDVSDDVADQDKQDIASAIRLVMDEFNLYGVPDKISETYFNGALYGTGIAKIVVEKVAQKSVDEYGVMPSIVTEDKFCVKVIPICPRNFAIDPSAASIDEALGCAHILRVPLSSVLKKVANGTYRSDIEVYPYNDTVEDLNALGETESIDSGADSVKVVEYHGLVPKSMISPKEQMFADLGEQETLDTTIKTKSAEEMVEAIVTVINDSIVARAVENPFLFGDRSIIAYQHDTVPNRFWGRGVAEKGYNPQKALDAEVRARIDALALSTHPMMAIDATKIPRGETFAIRPGRSILTTGNPSETLMPIKFPAPDPYTFQQTQELREMIQRGTGSYELPANVDNNRMAATSMSMVVGSMIKRSRRTLSNIERQFLQPLVQKVLYRYMQFDPERFPMKDYKFIVRASMGIMAREFEQGQLVSLLSTVPSESPAFWMLIRGIYTTSNIEDREQMIKFSEMMLQKALQPPPPPEPDPRIQIEMAKIELDAQKHKDNLDLETIKAMQLDRAYEAEAKRDEGEGRMQTATAILQSVKAETEKIKAASESALNMAKVESERIKLELQEQKQRMDAMRAEMELQLKMATMAMQAVPNAKGVVISGGMEAPEGEEYDDMEDKMEEKEPAPIPKMDLEESTFERLTRVIQEQISRLVRKNIEDTSKMQVMEIDALKQGQTQIVQLLNELRLRDEQPVPQETQDGGPQIERGPDGMVVSINGRPVKRDEQGRLMGVE
jgi:predicted GNAT family acetyltransferase